MAEKKMTKAVAFATAAEALAASHPEVAEVLAKEAAYVKSRNSAPKKPTATQVANAELKETILAAMEPGVKMTCTEVCKMVGVESNQRVSAVLNQMVKVGTLMKETGKKSLFYLPEVE